MNKIYYSKIHENAGGLSNQIFAFITSILIANVLTHEKAVIYKDFLCDYQGNKLDSISNIFDLKKMNVYLQKNFDVVIFDKEDVNLKINTVTYGTDNDNCIDITKEVIHHFYKDNTFFISQNVDFNSIGGDPYPHISKKLYINYSLNEYNFNEVFEEDRKKDIIFNLNNADYKYTLSWINNHHKETFDELLRHIYFTPKFLEISNNFINKNIDKSKKTNILHLRLEDDAMIHWCRMNNMQKNEFKTYIEDKYIDIISRNISKEDNNIILSYSQDNNVINFMKNNNYNYFFIEKNKNLGRETNAIIDLLISNACNNIFIGNFDMSKLWGSTFSYFIMSRFKPDIKVFLINLDKIKEGESQYLTQQIFQFSNINNYF